MIYGIIHTTFASNAFHFLATTDVFAGVFTFADFTTIFVDFKTEFAAEFALHRLAH